MKILKRIFIFTFVFLWLVLEVNASFGQGAYSTMTGIVKGMRTVRTKMWLDVENQKDKVIVNFRVGHKTVYTPQRYPDVGERVKVEYLTQHGVPVAYTVTILQGKK